MTTKTKPLVSVVIPFFNSEKFLSESIESVLRQEYENWELLLIDDGSTDKGIQIALSYVAKQPNKIFYFDHAGHRNKGLSATRNAGIRKAKGEYVAFIDSDDVWLPGFLANQVALILKHDVSMVIEATEYWYDWQPTNKKNNIVRIGVVNDHAYDPPQLMLDLYPLGRGTSPCTCAFLIKRDVLTKFNGFEEAFKGMYEDQVFFSKILMEERVFVSSSCNNRYRIRPDSMMRESYKNKAYHQIRKQYLLWFKGYLRQRKIKHHRINKLMRIALLPYRYPLLHKFLHSVPTKGLKLKQLVKRLGEQAP